MVLSLEEQNRMLEQGESTQEGVDAAQDELDTLDRQMMQYRILQKEAKLTIDKFTGQGTEGMDLSVVMLLADTSQLDVSELSIAPSCLLLVYYSIILVHFFSIHPFFS